MKHYYLRPALHVCHLPQTSNLSLSHMIAWQHFRKFSISSVDQPHISLNIYAITASVQTRLNAGKDLDASLSVRKITFDLCQKRHSITSAASASESSHTKPHTLSTLLRLRRFVKVWQYFFLLLFDSNHTLEASNTIQFLKLVNY